MEESEERIEYVMNTLNDNLDTKVENWGLTQAEKEEQAVLRREYIDSYKASLIGQLDNTYIVDKNGNKRKLERKNNG